MRLALAGLAAAFVAAAGATAAQPPWVVVYEECLTRAEKKLVVGVRASDRTRLVGVALGRGATGIVLVHGARSDFCEWIDQARKLARTYNVLAIDLRAHGSSYEAAQPLNAARFDLDIAAAAAELRRRGAKRVIAIGSSLGAGAVVIAGARVQPPLAGVVALSAPLSRGGDYDTAVAARRLRVPVLYVAATGDRQFAADARTLYRLTATKRKQLLVVPGSGHGSGHMYEARPAAAVRRFLAAHG